MANYKKLVLLVSALLVHVLLTAQTMGAEAAGSTRNDGFMRSEGKIFVVMAVVITILVGLILYIIRLDRKITKLEKGE
jgi:uncharacterized membrane protein